MAQKYDPPNGPPPSYPQQPPPAHYDAGPADPRAQGGYYGSPAPNGYGQQPYPPQGYQQNPYGSPAPGPYQQGPYGPPPPGQQMYYQQQPMYGPGYVDDGRRGGAGEGICAGLLGALACCCCLDFLF